MTRDEAMQLARAEYKRGIMDGMGINLIAEAWDIPRYQVVRHGDGYGLMTEGYLLAEMAKLRQLGCLRKSQITHT